MKCVCFFEKYLSEILAALNKLNTFLSLRPPPGSPNGLDISSAAANLSGEKAAHLKMSSVFV